jgi:rhodanese-related sulfurtransferase
MKQVIIDVREPEEYQSGHVSGAINIPPADLLAKAEEKLSGVAKNARIIVYCRTGSRSNVAKQILEQLGYTNIVNGINKDWVEAKQ